MTELTKFEAWVKSYTPARLVEQLANRGERTRVSLSMVYAWVRGEHEPRSEKRRVIMQLSKLTLEDLDAHFLAKRAR